MAQALPRFCPRCGTPTRTGMRLCATCGLSVDAMRSRSDNRQSQPGVNSSAPFQGNVSEPAHAVPAPRHTGPDEQQYQPPTAQDFLPTWGAPAEPPPALYSSPAPQAQQGPNAWEDFDTMPNSPDEQPWQAQAEPHFPSPSSPAPGPWDAPNRAQNNPGPQSWAAQAETMQPPAPTPAPRPAGRRRLGIVLVLLAILLVLGAGGYLAVSLLGLHVPGLSKTQATIKTTNLNTTVNYAGIDITLLNVQQAQNFLDDPQTADTGMLRLNLREQNRTSITISWNYNQSARLIVQGKQAIAPVYVTSTGSIAPGATRTSVIDFAIANGGNLSNTVFQLGTASEAQMQIPLTAQANLSQYQPKTTQQNGTMVYFGLNWTLTSATTSLNIPGQQAPNGMKYLTLTLKIDNTLSQEAISGSPFDYLRVKAGGKTATPISTTIPVSFAAGQMGKTGTATFLIPQNSTSCTLILLSQDPGGSGQASTDFQIG